MKYTFELRKEITIEAHDKGILITDVKSAYDNGDYSVYFEWDRVPLLIETLKEMHTQWIKEDEA